MESLRSYACVALAFALLGCSADASAPEDMADGRVLRAKDGPFSASFLIEDATKGWNELRVQVFDEDDAPLAGVTVKVTPWMPAHGHMSEEVVAEETESGVYETEDVLFFMAGNWELHAEVVHEKTTEHFVVPVHVAEP